MSLVNRLTIFALLAVSGLLLISTGAKAQQSSTQFMMDNPLFVPEDGLAAQGRVSEVGYFDSNPLLQTTKAKSLWGSITSPELLVNDITPMTTVMSDTVFTSNNFNQSNFDSNDVHEKFNVARQNQMWQVGLLGDFDYDTTRTSELSIYNNLQTTPVRHIGGYASPTITYNFLPTDHISLTGNYSESSYSTSSFTDYNSYSLSPGYSHDFDPLNKGFFTLTAQHYQALSGASSKTDSIGPQIGWQTVFTDQLKGTASVGFEETRSQITGVSSPWTAQYTMNGSINFRGEQDLTNAQISRDEYPFGNGSEALLTQIVFNETHAINGLFSIAGSVSYQSANYQAQSAGNLDSLATGTASLIYHVTNKVDLTGSYEYERETLVSISNDAEKHVALLTLSYSPQTWNLR